jgi:hypothetical protein
MGFIYMSQRLIEGIMRQVGVNPTPPCDSESCGISDGSETR